MNGELTGLFSLIGDSVLAAVLIWFIYQFRTGQIMPKAVHDEIIAVYEKRIKLLQEEASAAISELMEGLDHLASAHVAICPFITPEATEDYLEALKAGVTRADLAGRPTRKGS